jgi:hypothetical protein
VGGPLQRLQVKKAVGGIICAPAAGANTIHAQSALLGDVIAPGSTRGCQIYYRDPSDLHGADRQSLEGLERSDPDLVRRAFFF